MRIHPLAPALAVIFLVTTCGHPQTMQTPAPVGADSSTAAKIPLPVAGALPDAPLAQTSATQTNPTSSSAPDQAPQAPENPDKQTRAQQQGIPNDQQQPKRILGLMPNYRAVSAGEIPVPATSTESFKIATQNSFDYSSYVFTVLTSLLAKGTDAHPDLGKGVPGLWAYTWRGFLDKTDGNYMVIWALPTLLHEDERYYALGHGSKWKRLGYSLSQVAVARNYQDKPTLNLSEFLGRAGAQAVSTTYYPSADANYSDLSAKYAYSLLRDGATNAFREFWPDIAVHVLHRQP